MTTRTREVTTKESAAESERHVPVSASRIMATLEHHYPAEDAAYLEAAVDNASIAVRPVTLGLTAEQFSLDWLSQLHSNFDDRCRDADRLARPEQPACMKGCDHCCRIKVVCTIPEALNVAEWLRASLSETELATVQKRVESVACLARAHRAADDRPPVECPLLVDGSCSIYPVRPLICRGVVSYDDEACRADFIEGKEGVDVPFGRPRHALASAYNVALEESLFLAGLPSTTVDFHIALDIALSHPLALIQWLSGETLFADAIA